MKRYAFYVSGSSGRLLKFLKQAEKKHIAQIEVVISEYELQKELSDILLMNDIDQIIFDYGKLIGVSNKEKNLHLSNKMVAVLEERQIDYCFSFGSHILSGKLLDKFKFRLINFHPAILPMYPGRKAIDQAIEQGNTFLVGNTAHFIDAGVDTGPIIMQSIIPLEAFFETGNNYNTVLDLQIDMLNQIIKLLNEDRISVQNESVIIKGANYRHGIIFPVT